MQRALVFAVLAFVAIACGGNDGSGPNNGNNNSNKKIVTATVNGTAFTATTVSGAFLNGSLTINGASGVQALTLNALNITGPGTISLNVGNQWSALGQWIDGNVGQFSSGFGGVGTVTITAASLTRITGTFSFTAYTSAGTGLGKPVVTIQNGVFDITNP